MLRRLAATTALVLAGLALSPAARAQGFFSFYEMSPGDVLSRLDDQGYAPRVPMTRRGDVYIVDAQTSSGRPVRLIVSVHDGRVLERYPVAPRWREEFAPHPRWRDGDPRRSRDDDDTDQAALGDPSRPRVLNFDGQNPDRLIPPAAVPDAAAPERPRHRVAKKPTAPPVAKDAPEPATADVAPTDAKPAPEAKPAAPRIIELPKAVAAPLKPAPEPTAQAKVEAPKPEISKIVREPTPQAQTPQAKVEDKPAPKPDAPKVVREVGPAQAKVEDKPKAEDKPKPEAPRKKLNDLPVGTLD